MPANNLIQIVIEFGLTCLFFFAFAIIGNLFLRKFGTEHSSFVTSFYGQLFNSFFCGLLIVIFFYSVIVTKGLTVNLLVLPVFYYLFIGNHTEKMIKDTERLKGQQMPFLEVGFISLLVIIILHVFPQSEYKQADSFFYLKIAESLNATGQENISHYFNLYNNSFHGMEPYHYFEIWITALIIRCTESFYPSVNIERYVTQAIILTAVIAGLYYLAEGVLKKKINIAKKIFCWSLLFILPNFIFFSPSLYNIFISDFEGNILERPNFRIIYLILIPVILKLYNNNPIRGQITYLLLFACIVSFKCAAVILPSMLVYNVYSALILKRKEASFNWLHLTVFCLLLAGIYFLFSVNKIPGFYQTNGTTFLMQVLKGWKFIIYSTIMSVFYVLLLAVILLLPLIIKYKNDLIIAVKESVKKFKLLLLIAAAGLIMARVLYLKDNAYQFLFITHIIVTIFIWLVYLLVLLKNNKQSSYLFSAVFLSIFWFIKPLVSNQKFVNIFDQNGNFVYEGKKYSQEYLNKVMGYFKEQKNSVGGYLADTNFYKNTYYSRRNPNVYFLPVTYILSDNYNRNFEFCLSDTSAIICHEDNPVYKEYLTNAIHRSFFYQYLKENPSIDYSLAVNNFINHYHLSYLFITKDYDISSLVKSKVKSEIVDPVTGERFLILQED